MATTNKPSEADANPIPGLPSLEDLGKLMQDFKLPGVDVGALVDWQRKDLEALAEANRQAYEGFQALVQRRNEMLQEAFAGWQQQLQGATGQGGLAQLSEGAQQGVQQAIANFRELAEMEARTRGDAWKVVQDRLEENLQNLSKLLQPK